MSLKIEKQSEGIKDTVLLSGRLDTTTAPELEAFMEKELRKPLKMIRRIFSSLEILKQYMFSFL